jgi:two-component system nitrogen regulation sensor histidine kinase NtrY
MIEELERSAELLARSEREGAWREMARQVAHEIKNPLTPMKLSVQYMQKTWADNAPDREQRLDRFSRTLIEQIDALSSIASEFSDFAKMPAPFNEKLDLNEVLGSVLGMYADLENIVFTYEPAWRNAIIFADRKQLLRVFTNLLNNAVQAIGDRPSGQVLIGLTMEDGRYKITISDNGSGIPEEQSGRIFQPNFTTKTGGMGLGLAIVRGIIDSMQGDITFVAREGGGTTFTMFIPALKEIQTEKNI